MRKIETGMESEMEPRWNRDGNKEENRGLQRRWNGEMETPTIRKEKMIIRKNTQ